MQTMLLVGLTLLNSAAGVTLQIAIARRFGVGVTSDAYYGALAGPLFCIGLFLAQSTFRAVPALMLVGSRGINAWRASGRSYFNTAVILGLCVAPLGALICQYAGIQQKANAMGVPFKTLNMLCWGYAAAQFPLVALVGLLQSRHRYYTALVITSLPQVCACAGTILWTRQTIACVPAALVIATVLCVVAIRLAVLGREEVYSKHDGSLTFGWRIIGESPFTAATLTCFSIYAVVDSALLPRFGSGYLTSANLCQRVVIGVGQLVIAAPMTLITRNLVRDVEARDPSNFQRTVARALIKVASHGGLLAVVLYASGDRIMSLMLGNNANSGYAATAARTLRYMLPGMVLMLASNVLVRSALAIPGVVRKTWWLGVVWAIIYGGGVVAISTPVLNGSGVAYTIAWTVMAGLLGLFLKCIALPSIRRSEGRGASLSTGVPIEDIALGNKVV